MPPIRGLGGLLAFAVLSSAGCPAGPAGPEAPSPAPLAAPARIGIAHVQSDGSPPGDPVDASSPDAPAPAASPALARPDPGPGRFACGETTCNAGEVCAPKDACGDPRDKGCITEASLKARATSSASCRDGCSTWYDQKSCDGPGDCNQGEVCCYSRQLIIGPCDDGDDGFLDVYECKRAVAGHTPCGTAEICSDKDSTCKRRGSSCVTDPSSGLGTCAVQRRGVACGSAPCGPGLVCVESPTDSKHTCVRPGSAAGRVIECNRGRDCAPDEACFARPGGRQCDLSALSWAGQDFPLCDDASDCVGFCRGSADAVCHDWSGDKRCECRPGCQRDADCKRRNYCTALSLSRYGGALLELDAFCDKRQQRCDCRERGP